jgi:hypothetical protein
MLYPFFDFPSIATHVFQQDHISSYESYVIGPSLNTIFLPQKPRPSQARPTFGQAVVLTKDPRRMTAMQLGAGG